MNHPVRILQVATIMDLGGLENFLMNLYRNIDRTKLQFDFLVHRHNEGAFDKEILDLGGKIYRFNPIKPLQYFQYISELNVFFKNHPEYAIVHSHINATSAFILKVAKKQGVPVRIAHSHIAASVKSYKVLVDMLATQVPKQATHRLACSQDAGKWLYGNHDFLIFNNAIDTDKFRFNKEKREEIRSSLRLNEEDILIGHVGRFNHQKNHEFIIKIFSVFLSNNPNSKLILIGEGDLKEKLVKQIKDLGIKDHVVFTGAIQNSQDYLSAMDLYLFPSLVEGLPLALVEAQSNGLPILMSDSIPQDSVLTDLINQERLQSSDKEWSKKIEELLKSYKNNDRSVYSEKVLLKGFDVVENAKRIEQLYLTAHSKK